MEIKTKLLYLDVKNTNGRIYTQKCALKMMEQFNAYVHNTGALLGELGYPEKFEITLSNVSHKVKSLSLDLDKNYLEGTIEILEETPNGQKVLRALGWTTEKFDDLFAVRPRGSGIVEETGEIDYESYKLYTFDIIPKNQDAFKNVEDKLK